MYVLYVHEFCGWWREEARTPPAAAAAGSCVVAPSRPAGHIPADIAPSQTRGACAAAWARTLNIVTF